MNLPELSIKCIDFPSENLYGITVLLVTVVTDEGYEKISKAQRNPDMEVYLPASKEAARGSHPARRVSPPE